MVTTCAHQLLLQAVFLTEDQEIGVVNVVHSLLTAQLGHFLVIDEVVAILPNIFGSSFIVPRATTPALMQKGSSQDVQWPPSLGLILIRNCDSVG